MGHIGDVVLVTPALDLLHTMFPDAEISVLVRAGTEAMLRDHPRVTRVFTGGEIASQQVMHVQTRKTLTQRLAQIPRGFGVIRALRAARFDVVVDFTGGDRSAMLGFFSGASIRVGPASRGHGMKGRDRLYTRTAVLPGDTGFGFRVSHKVMADVALLRVVADATGRTEFAIDGALVPGPASIAIPSGDVIWAHADWASMPKPGAPRVIVHPTSRVLYKCWPADRWASVINRLVDERHVNVMITSGPGEKEVLFARTIVGACRPHVRAHLGDLSLGRLSALIRDADLFLGVDTAPMHIATAVGTRVVAVFGPSDDTVWGPWGDGHHVVRKTCTCLESGVRGCDETQGMRCLSDVSADEFYDVVRSALTP